MLPSLMIVSVQPRLPNSCMSNARHGVSGKESADVWKTQRHHVVRLRKRRIAMGCMKAAGHRWRCRRRCG